jgi:hypothetical protein
VDYAIVAIRIVGGTIVVDKRMPRAIRHGKPAAEAFVKETNVILN